MRFRKKVRCIDCGFLSYARRADEPWDDDEAVGVVTLRDRDTSTWIEQVRMNLTCYRGEPSAIEDFRRARDGDETAVVIEASRNCAYHARFVPGGDFARHLDTQAHRRAEVAQWARLVAAALIAFALGVLTRFI